MATDQSRRRRLTGEVVSDRMHKTAIVVVTRRFAHPVYKKYVMRSKRYYVHDERNECHVGDKVIIEAIRPLSKLKRWRLLEITRPGIQAEAEV